MKPRSTRSRIAFLLSLLLLTACQQAVSIDADNDYKSRTNLPPISQAFSCLPKEAAFIAAHRGTSKKASLAENSINALEALIQAGIYFAEVDVASLKDGTHILIHDGLFDRTTITTGPVSSSIWTNVDTLLLRDTEGNITSDTLPKFEDYLKVAKGQIYLEIDFKSSAKYQTVINEIRSQDMSNQVILIAYSEGQARKLAELAPEMMISATVKTPENIQSLNSLGIETTQIAAWTGRDLISSNLRTTLENKKIPVLAMRNPQVQLSAAKNVDLIVSDYALQSDPILNLKNSKIKSNFKECLNKDIINQ